jgi:hypothetical protein
MKYIIQHNHRILLLLYLCLPSLTVFQMPVSNEGHVPKQSECKGNLTK